MTESESGDRNYETGPAALLAAAVRLVQHELGGAMIAHDVAIDLTTIEQGEDAQLPSADGSS